MLCFLSLHSYFHYMQGICEKQEVKVFKNGFSCRGVLYKTTKYIQK